MLSRNDKGHLDDIVNALQALANDERRSLSEIVPCVESVHKLLLRRPDVPQMIPFVPVAH
ncbi:MAG: hypothetical protein OXD42_04680 [Rhodospirillaceae bacterium]|nr:hypothetical protein [Rhodospirillaceae bacterium]